MLGPLTEYPIAHDNYHVSMTTDNMSRAHAAIAWTDHQLPSSRAARAARLYHVAEKGDSKTPPTATAG